MPMVTFNCYHCGAELGFVDRVPVRAECEKCQNDAHVCRNCQHYDVKVYNECKEPQAEVVREKDRSNVCDYFTPGGGAGGGGKSRDDLMKAAEALFKKR